MKIILCILFAINGLAAVDNVLLANAKAVLSTYDQKYNPFEGLSIGGIPPTYELKDNDKRLNYIAAVVVKDYFDRNSQIGDHEIKRDDLYLRYVVSSVDGNTTISIKLGWDPYLLAVVETNSISWTFIRNDGSNPDHHSLKLLSEDSPN